MLIRGVQLSFYIHARANSEQALFLNQYIISLAKYLYYFS